MSKEQKEPIVLMPLSEVARRLRTTHPTIARKMLAAGMEPDFVSMEGTQRRPLFLEASLPGIAKLL